MIDSLHPWADACEDFVADGARCFGDIIDADAIFIAKQGEVGAFMHQCFGHVGDIKAQHIHCHAANERHFIVANIANAFARKMAQIPIRIAASDGGDARAFGGGDGGVVVLLCGAMP